jgi:hypothetical protein
MNPNANKIIKKWCKVKGRNYAGVKRMFKNRPANLQELDLLNMQEEIKIVKIKPTLENVIKSQGGGETKHVITKNV